MNASIFDVEKNISLVVSFSLNNWGKELVFDCLSDPEFRKPCKLLFTNCRQLKWEFYDFPETENEEADIIGFAQGKQKYMEPAILTTDFFEVFIFYDEIFLLNEN